jgi:hypothetical protein
MAAADEEFELDDEDEIEEDEGLQSDEEEEDEEFHPGVRRPVVLSPAPSRFASVECSGNRESTR